MTVERRLFHALGGSILAGMIAVAAFSLGVYVGRQGWALPAPSIVGPGDQPPSPPQAPEPPQPLGEPGQPRPDLIGLVRHATGESLAVQTREGLRSVSLNGQTRIVRRVDDREERAPWSDLGRGVPVAVFGRFDDDGRTLTARLIVILPPQLP